MSGLDGLGEGLSLDEGSKESSGEGVSGSVGVDDLVVRHLGDGERLGVLLSGVQVAGIVGRGGGGDEGRRGSLGDDHKPRLGRVLLGEVGDGGGDRGGVGGLEEGCGEVASRWSARGKCMLMNELRDRARGKYAPRVRGTRRRRRPRTRFR